MNQMQSLEAHLTALHDELSAAAKAEESQARERIDAALQHIEAAQAQLKARTSARTEQIGAHLDTLREHGAHAANERGETLRERLHKMMATCKDAIGHCIEEQTMTP